MHAGGFAASRHAGHGAAELEPSRGRGGLPSLNMWDLAGVWRRTASHRIGFQFHDAHTLRWFRADSTEQEDRHGRLPSSIVSTTHMHAAPCSFHLTAHRWSGRFAAARKVATASAVAAPTKSSSNPARQPEPSQEWGFFAHPSIHRPKTATRRVHLTHFVHLAGRAKIIYSASKCSTSNNK